MVAPPDDVEDSAFGISFSRARLSIARVSVAHDGSLAKACEHAARVSARALGVARVGVWLFSEDGAELRCEYLHCEDGSAPPDGPLVLHTRDYPEYVAALRAHRWICADDAQADPLTAELRARYLVPLGITSMLDAPIFRGGQLIGIVCHEHRGPKRKWLSSDRAFAGSVADIVSLVYEQSERIDAEERLRQQAERAKQGHKLEALGRLAAAVAHDFNNLLGAVDALAATVERRGQANEEDRGAVRAVREVVDRGKGLTRQLLTFARQQPVTTRRLDLTALVSGLRPILTTLTRERCELALEVDDLSRHVYADPTQIEQIVINLVLNAVEAMPHGGEVEVALEDGTAHGRPYAILRVSDEGIGIDEPVRSRIFEPFFTTKAEGTGLGLSTVHGIAHQLGGVVEVDSYPGRGTTFRVAVPLAT